MPFKNNRNSRDDKSSKNNPSKRSRIDPQRSDRTNSTPEERFGEKRSSFKKESKLSALGRRNSTTKGHTNSEKSGNKNNKPYDRRPSAPGGVEKAGRTDEARPRTGGKSYGTRESDNAFRDKKPWGERGNSAFRKEDDKRGGFRKSFNKDDRNDRPADRYRKDDRKWSSEERVSSESRPKKQAQKAEDGLIRLNRYIANAGICSRRKADDLIAAGVISVNGQVASELGLKIDPFKDEIRYNGQLLKREKMVYVLLNKPKDYITTTDDPQERRTVMQLVEKASRERIYPVGRLDRNTTGLLLMTNDGDLADKLSHPRNNITKIYQAELNKNLTQGDLNKIAFGLELEDGPIKPDVVSYVQGGTKREVGIQIHSGKNRIVRRIFEHLGYEVVKLDRVVYANLTKKDLPRGRWRYLEEKEIIQLKHLMQ